MESLGDSLKELRDRTEAAYASAADKLDGHYVMRRFREKYPEVTEETIARYINLFRRLVEEFENCSPCLTLDRCKNICHGHKTTLDVVNNGAYIYEQMTPCKHNKGGRIH